MKATCLCGQQWEIVNGQPVKCWGCDSIDRRIIAKFELSVSEDFKSLSELPDGHPLKWDFTIPEPMPLSGPDLTCIGHLIMSIENAAHALRSAFINHGKGPDKEGRYDNKYTDAAKKLEHDAYQLRRQLEDLAKRTGAQLYMLS